MSSSPKGRAGGGAGSADDRTSRTLRLDLSYEGTAYHGFGVQPNRRTVQEVLEEALARSLGERVRVVAAGRTDAGVHASGQVVSFSTRGRLAAPDLLRATNARLPRDVHVDAAAEMPPTFDARRSALRRHYRYLIWSSPRSNLWWRRWAWHLTDRPDPRAMQAAADLLVGTHDFASFVGHRSQEPTGRTTVRAVERAAWWREGELLGFEITASAFVRHMVRGIVGTLIEVGRGRLEPAQFGAILEAADRRRAGPNAPPHGLILTGVDYPDEYRTPSDSSTEANGERTQGPGWRPGDRSSVPRDEIGG